MTRLFFLFGQVAAELPARSIWDIALQFGMAGAVILVVFFFLAHLKGRDEKDERISKALTESIDKLGTKMGDLSTSVSRLDAHLVNRGPAAKQAPPV